MNYIRFSIFVLLKDFKNNLHYLYSIIVLSTINLIFSNINYYQGLKVEMKVNQFGNMIPRYTSFVVFINIAFAIILALYSYSYLLNKKNLEINLLKTSGGGLKKVGLFLMVQNIFLIAIGTIIGMIIGILLIPIVNMIIFNYIGKDDPYFLYHTTAFIDCININLLVMVVTSILAFGYVQKNEVKKSEYDILKDNRKFKFSAIFHIFLYGAGIGMFITSKEVTFGAVIFSLIGCCGASGIIRIELCDIIRKRKKKTYYADKIRNIADSNLIFSLRANNMLILAMLFVSTVMLSWAIGSLDVKEDFVIALMSYIFSLILLTISIMFNFIINFNKRNQEYVLLYKSGYTIKLLEKVIFNEVFQFYFIIFIFSFIYIILIFVHPIIAGRISIITSAIMIFIYIALMTSVMFVTLCLAKKSMKENILCWVQLFAFLIIRRWL